MTNEFFTRNKDAINNAIEHAKVKYTSSSGNGTNTVVHCYYIDSKDVCISAYAMKNKVSNNIRKYILKVMVKSDTKTQKSVSSARDTDKYAKRFFSVLESKFAEQIAKTQLRQEWKNPAFIHKR